LIEQEYAARYAQRLVFRALRSLEDSDRPPGSKWTVDALEGTFRRVRQRRLYRHARRAFAAFLQSVGRLAPPADNGPHASVLAAYQRFLSEVRGLAPTTIAQHLPEVSALLRHALPEGEALKRLTAEAIEQYIERRACAVSRAFLRAAVGHLRAFLSYCFERRWVTTRLDALDQPVSFRNERPPRALEWRIIQQLLRSIKRTDQTGWRDFMVKYIPEADLHDTNYVNAYNSAMALEAVLKACGDDLSTENILKQAYAIKDLELPMLLPGIKVNTSPTDHVPVDQMQFMRFSGKTWERFGELQTGN